jgi:outer membrane protein assembly factor BamA
VGVGVDTEIAHNLRLVQNLYTLSFPYDDRIIGVVDDRQNNRVASIGTQFVFDNRDNIFNPTRGWLISSGIEYAAPLIGSDRDSHFAVFRQSMGTYLQLTPLSVVALSLSYARLWGLGDTRGIPLTRRLTLGGRTSVRALSEKELQFNDVGLVGQDSLEGKIEYRQPVLLNLGLAFFVDFGSLSALRFVDPAIKAQYKPFVIGPGIGLRLGTPVGPVALDFAFRTDSAAGKSPFRVQVSIGNF